MRPSGRQPDELREITIVRGYTKHAEGSVLIACGDTRVICTASVDEKVPAFLRGRNQGWLTAEYGMLPRSTGTRIQREAARGRPSGRTQEIQRLIGRALRAVMDLTKLGERTIQIDCDVVQADGGTRTASINGAYVALADALAAHKRILGPASAIVRGSVAAVSVGSFENAILLDLDYVEDKDAEVDLNLVMTGDGRFVEVQGTGEEATFTRAQLDQLLELGQKGIAAVTAAQRQALGSAWPER
jgi:ribonuclease PH